MGEGGLSNYGKEKVTLLSFVSWVFPLFWLFLTLPALTLSLAPFLFLSPAQSRVPRVLYVLVSLHRCAVCANMVSLMCFSCFLALREAL